MRASSKSSNTSPENEMEHTHAAIIVDDHDVTKSEIVPRIVEGSLSTSPSSSTLSDEDFFQIDTGKHSKPKTGLYEISKTQFAVSFSCGVYTTGIRS